ncbi:hypothetical protein SAMN05660691_02428 [Rheinheimera pacifica]|uniref:Uncharacterized protein n=1 Tax=Rheinheimera pacifica TaxID=173990 RepID=A0A1H6M3A3_9GAMM|nr:hypothetical protein [Rheinheimera pacifica]SEH95688.1 hypothetical protein SAMN05660691_02428 [Rheinheimera pacifica]
MKYLVMFVVILLSGCASPPKDINEFYSGKFAVRDLSSPYSPEKTHNLLFTELVKCYQRESSSTIPIPAVGTAVKLSQSSYVEYDILENGTRQLALVGEAGWNRFYQQLVEVKADKDNTTLVQVYEISSGWEKHTARIAGWLQGQEAKGCGLW